MVKVKRSGAFGRCCVGPDAFCGMPDQPVKSPRFLSAFRHKVDLKRRVQLPAEWGLRGPAGADLTLLLWPHNDRLDSCLMVMPPAAADDFMARLSALPVGASDGEAIKVDMAANAASLSVDSVGRIAIPDWMAERVGIVAGGEVVLNGVWDRFQLWNAASYDETRPAVRAVATTAFRKLT